MRARIGAHVDAEHVRVALVERGRREVLRTKPVGNDWAETLRSVLLDPAVKAGTIGIAFGSNLVKLKTIHGIPRDVTPATALQIVRRRPARYLIGPLPDDAYVGIDNAGNGHELAIYDSSAVDRAVSVCQELRLRLRVVAPAVRLAANPATTDDDLLVARRIADVDDTRIGCPRARGHTVRRIRRAFMVGVACAGGLIAVVLPLGRATAVEHQDARMLAALSVDSAMFAKADDELHSIQLRLDAVTQFRQNSRSALRVLTALAEGLPDSSAVTSLQLDSLGLVVTTLSTDALAVGPALLENPIFTSAQLEGAVAHGPETDGALERATFRITLARLIRDPANGEP